MARKVAASAGPWRAKRGDPFAFFNIHCSQTSKNWRGTFWWKNIFRKKVSQCRKKLKGDPLGFFNIHSVAKHQEIEGGPFGGDFFRKKVSQSQKTERVEPLVSPGTECYAEKQEKPFWFSSLGQMIQFGTIKFCRTFKNYFGQFVWIEKKKKKESL